MSTPLAAQDGEQSEERVLIDLLVPPPAAEPDELDIERCEAEADVARIRGEIVVCRSLEASDQSGWDREDFERRYAEATPGDTNPQVDGSGVRLPTEGSVATITVTMKFGDPGDQPLIIDVEALPEAAPGSDADRRGRGLPPRN